MSSISDPISVSSSSDESDGNGPAEPSKFMANWKGHNKKENTQQQQQAPARELNPGKACMQFNAVSHTTISGMELKWNSIARHRT